VGVWVEGRGGWDRREKNTIKIKVGVQFVCNNFNKGLTSDTSVVINITIQLMIISSM